MYETEAQITEKEISITSLEPSNLSLLCLSFLKLHITTQTLTTHTHSSLWTHDINPTIISIFEDWASKPRDWWSHHTKPTTENTMLPWEVEPRIWGGTETLAPLFLSPFQMEKYIKTRFVPGQLNFYTKNIQSTGQLNFYSKNIQIARWDNNIMKLNTKVKVTFISKSRWRRTWHRKLLSIRNLKSEKKVHSSRASLMIIS